jgi:hypothetical protein
VTFAPARSPEGVCHWRPHDRIRLPNGHQARGSFGDEERVVRRPRRTTQLLAGAYLEPFAVVLSGASLTLTALVTPSQLSGKQRDLLGLGPCRRALAT